MNDNLYVQYGCGFSAPREWRNFDVSPTLRIERLPLIGQLYTKNKSRFPENVEYGDIVKGLPLPAGSCACVYCSHVLEHLSLYDFRMALNNTKTILKRNGVFRFVLPDLEYLAKCYIGNPSDQAALEFMKDTFLDHERRSKKLKEFIEAWFGNSHHLWMWDYKSIKAELEKVVFMDVRRVFFGNSSLPIFGKVEDKDRWDNGLGVECRPPV